MDEDEYTEDTISEEFEPALSKLPPRVALAYVVLRDGMMQEKAVRISAKSLVLQYLTGEFDDSKS